MALARDAFRILLKHTGPTPRSWHMESVYSAIQVAIAFSRFLFVIGGLVGFLFALFFGRLSIRAIRNG